MFRIKNLLSPEYIRYSFLKRNQINFIKSLSSSNGQLDSRPILAIRREDNTVWERRAPLAPSHVKKLIKQHNVKVIVQPSNRRAYPMQEYANAGASIEEDLSEASTIIGVKNIPIDLLQPDKTYAFFSHTIKAQEANMPLLDAILEKDIRLIDYEKMVDQNGQRVVAFGQYAGVAGMINILHGMGLRLLALGHHTPFMHVGPAHNYRNSGMAKQVIRDAGYEIALGLMPKSLGPLTFIFTGTGNVSQGAQEIFNELPHEYIDPEHLPKVSRHGSVRKLYACIVSREDHYVRSDGGGFDAKEFEEHPERYSSKFSKMIAPYASCIINGIYWAPNSPRLLTIPDAKNLLAPQTMPWLPLSPGCPQLPHRLLAVCDISADPGGSIEFMKDCTTIDSPFCLYDADANMDTESFSGPGVLICSIDNMPTQLPREATDFFGNLLLPYVKDLIKSDASTPFEQYDVGDVVKNAVIASNGKLTPNFSYIDDLRKSRSHSSASQMAQMNAMKSSKRVLILGAGFVSAPVVDYITRDKDISVTVIGSIKEDIDKLANRFINTTPVLLDIHRSQDELEKLIQNHDLVISLLPYALHPEVGKLCVRHKINMVTASYLSPAMKELSQAAQEAGITILNEVGVDPGIDHMLAIQCFDDIKQNGGKVTSFISWCGGLPAPEFSDNPLRYKFNWSPKGVLLNILSGAKFLQEGKVLEIEGNGGLLNNVMEVSFLPGFNFEAFPNRDSLPYLKLYDIESAKTCLRGTLRYKGFSTTAAALLKLGLIQLDANPLLHQQGPDITWREFMCELLGTKHDILYDSLKDLVVERLDGNVHQLNAIENLGLLEDILVDKKNTPIDTLSNYLTKKLAYNEGECDILVMRHDIGIQWPSKENETRHVNLTAYGNPNGYSAMAATVGFPTGIAAKMIMDGEIQQRGCILPFTTDIYRPILKRLELEGINSVEHVTSK